MAQEKAPVKKEETKESQKSQEKKAVETPKVTDKKEDVKLAPVTKEKKETAKKTSKKGEEKKAEIERIYVVPLRRGFLKVPRHKRSKKAIKTLKEFLAKHMKVEDRDVNKVKLDMYLNNEVWFRGIKKPLHKIKVKVKKVDGIVYAELAEMPEVVRFKKQKDEKKKTKVDKKKLDKVVTQEAAEEKKKDAREDKADATEAKEKEKATVEAGLAANQAQAKEMKHTAKHQDAKMDKMSSTTKRKALKK